MAAKNARTVWLTAIPIGAAIIGLLIWVGWDLDQKHGQITSCADGPHGHIDLRDFVQQYSQWSVTFEAEVQGKGKISTKLEPKQAQQLSEAVQQASEFRKFVVAGFNACAITSVQYARFGTLFQNLDSLERQIGQLTAKASTSPDDTNQLQKLVTEVVNVSKNLRQ
jgi:hypothetical protein